MMRQKLSPEQREFDRQQSNNYPYEPIRHEEEELTVNDDGGIGANVIIEGSNGQPIACVYGAEHFPCFDEDGQSIEDFHIECVGIALKMAAAAELQTALRGMLELWATVGGDQGNYHVERAEEALKRSESITP